MDFSAIVAFASAESVAASMGTPRRGFNVKLPDQHQDRDHQRMRQHEAPPEEDRVKPLMSVPFRMHLARRVGIYCPLLDTACCLISYAAFKCQAQVAVAQPFALRRALRIRASGSS